MLTGVACHLLFSWGLANFLLWTGLLCQDPLDAACMPLAPARIEVSP